MRQPLLAIVCTLALGVLAAQTSLAEIPCTNAGPQSPRDIDRTLGSNLVTFAKAPSISQMQLCDIHFHRFAEHRAAGYPIKVGHGDDHYGYACEGKEPTTKGPLAKGEHGDDSCIGVELGDTIEVHWVFTSCDVEPAPSLNSCFSPICLNPQVRVEAKVFYLSDGAAGELDFATFAEADDIVLPTAAGAVEYLGSSTGPKFNNETSCSPFQITWNVRPSCSPLAKASLDAWCSNDKVFDENKAHGVRQLVSMELRSRID